MIHLLAESGVVKVDLADRALKKKEEPGTLTTDIELEKVGEAIFSVTVDPQSPDKELWC